MELFPYFIIRMASGKMKDLHGMEVPYSIGQANKVMEANAEIHQLKETITQLLFETIAKQGDTGLQNKLLQLKRDVHNQRPISKSMLGLFAIRTSPSLLELLHGYMRLENNLRVLKEDFERTYDQEIQQTYRQLHLLSKDVNLRKGIMLSNQTLVDNMDKYIPRLQATPPRKKEWQTILGMMKYMTRMTTKTSPFSTFNHIGLGKITKAKTGDWGHRGEWGAKSVIRLNNYLFAYLKEALLKIESFRKQRNVRLNPSATLKNGHFQFLANSNNIESFQQIPPSPINALIKEELTGKMVRYQCLLESLCQQVDAPHESLRDYLDRLIDVGFLEFNFSTSGMDPDWDIHFGKELAEMQGKTPLTVKLTAVLQELRALTTSLEESNERERNVILDIVHSRFISIYEELNEASSPHYSQRSRINEKKSGDGTFGQIHFEAFRLKPHQMVFEDSRHTAAFEVSGKVVVPLIDKLNTLCRLMGRFEVQLDRKDKLKHYFLLRYGGDQMVDVLDFYENYYRDVELPETDQGINMPGSPTDVHTVLEVPDIKARRERDDRWKRELAKALEPLLLQNPHHLDLSEELLEGINGSEKTEIPPSKSTQSLSAFMQLYKTEADGWKAAVNLTYAGYGRMYSRFLHAFSPDVSNLLRKKNEALGRDGLMTESTDASYFNANLRPPLMPFELEVPNGHRNLPEGRQIPITEVGITYRQQTDQLHLVHKPTGKPLYLFDLGFQSLRGRSQLYQLLERFTPATYIYPSLITETINASLYLNKLKKGAALVQFPRISFEHDIILQRRSWFFAKKSIPMRHPTESDAMFFLRLNQWRIKHDLPAEVFIFVTTPQEMATLTEKEKRRVGTDNQKPQYISFSNPILIRLFEKMAQKVPKVLKVEEMLPIASQLAEMNGNQIVNECIFQWNN
ncbi:lantibiotic dehydratase [Echinicola rosea]|uniref:Lantibiotic dehydratase N-terminal domain-containing protein n=1 Tax=Echinicola rosea TaxID=1807691 RepID=A0ABQ1VB24_9BACT|nr:lantibiotic dehydratase [Echinicola rosea]GGF44458.1 hypothetical protein GCM10011339_36190 [Echinicola rosea]